MPYLLGLLMNFLVDFFGKKIVGVSLRIGISLAFVTLFIATIYAYISAAGVIIEAVSMTVPDIARGVWGWVMPSNTNVCLTSIGAVYILRFGIRQYLSLLNAKYLAVISGP